MSRAKRAGWVAASLLVAASPAIARVYTFDLYGGLYDGIDYFGATFFDGARDLGSPHVSLMGYEVRISATYEVDPDTYSGEALSGGSDLGTPSPLLSLTMTLNNHTLSFDTSQHSYLVSKGGFGSDWNFYEPFVAAKSQWIEVGTDQGFPAPTSIKSFALDPSFTAGDVQFTTEYLPEEKLTQFLGAYMYFQRGQISSPVPEPVAWALLISGMILVGGRLRARNKLMERAA